MEAVEGDYRVRLDVFEGPMDLLLHLIKKDDLNIYDIPVAHLLAQYLEYIQLAHELDIDLAGEFLEMAAELTFIKSKMLLPEIEEEADEGPDPRADLVQRLLEYQRYKQVAQTLLLRPMLGNDVFRRSCPVSADEEALIEADMSSMITAFQNLLKRLPEKTVHEIRQIRMGVAERILDLAERIKGKSRMSFEELFDGDATRADLVVTFMSVLEMARQGLLRILQEKTFQKIFVEPRVSDAPENVISMSHEEGESYGD